MGINLAFLQTILNTKIKGIGLSAGYPDLIIPCDQLPVALEFLIEHPNSKQIGNHHGVSYPIYETIRVFEGLGIVLETLDRIKINGEEKIIDLNIPHDLGQYDLVIDPGTSEHCFNIAQSFINLASAVKVGGYIIQMLPITMINHGYWNINPNVLQDFYDINGFSITELFLVGKDNTICKLPLNSRNMRMQGIPSEFAIIVSAHRLIDKPFKFPQQK